MKTVVILLLALASLSFAPVTGAATCVGTACVDAEHLADTLTCGAGAGAGCAYHPVLGIAAPACGDDGSGYACTLVVSTSYDAIGSPCVQMGVATDVPHEGGRVEQTCATGGWSYAGELTLTFRDIPAEGRDVDLWGFLAVGSFNNGDIGSTGTVAFWDEGTLHLPGP